MPRPSLPPGSPPFLPSASLRRRAEARRDALPKLRERRFGFFRAALLFLLALAAGGGLAIALALVLVATGAI